MKTVLQRIIRLDMHIMAGYGTSNPPLLVHGEIFPVHLGNLTDAMAEIHAMALATDTIVIGFEFPLA